MPNAVEFGNVMKSVTRGATITATELDRLESSVPTNFQYLMLSNIQNGMIDAELPYLKDIERKFLMHVIDMMVLAKGVRLEAHDLVPEIREGLEKKHPKFMDNFDIAYPIASMRDIERIREAGLDADYQEFCKTMPGVSVIAFACIVGGVITFNGKHFFDSGLLIFAAIFLHNAIGYITGYGVGCLARMTKAQKRTISIEVGMQNAGLATNLATHHFASAPEAALAAAVSCVWHSISGTFLAGIFRLIDKYNEKKNNQAQ
jgi:hypothetical protein